MKANLCWWEYTKQCRDVCRMCYLYLPVLRGQLDTPDFNMFATERMKQCLNDAFIKKNIKLTKTKFKRMPKLKLSKEEREQFIATLKETLKSLS